MIFPHHDGNVAVLDLVKATECAVFTLSVLMVASSPLAVVLKLSIIQTKLL